MQDHCLCVELALLLTFKPALARHQSQHTSQHNCAQAQVARPGVPAVTHATSRNYPTLGKLMALAYSMPACASCMQSDQLPRTIRSTRRGPRSGHLSY